MSRPTCREKCWIAEAARCRGAAGRRVRVRVRLWLVSPPATAREHCRALKLRRGGSRSELGVEKSNRARPQKSANGPQRQGPKTGSGYARFKALAGFVVSARAEMLCPPRQN